MIARKGSRVNSFFFLQISFFQVTVNNTNDGRTSKHSEYRYAKKLQTFQWKCQIASGNTRNMPGQKPSNPHISNYKHFEYQEGP